MAKGALVAPDIQFGQEVLQALDRAKFQAPVVLWLFTEERGDWRLIIASPLYDRVGPLESYHRLHRTLSNSSFDLVRQLPITMQGTRSSFVRALRQRFGKTASTEGMRLGGQSIGGVWIDDAYVYRIR